MTESTLSIIRFGRRRTSINHACAMFRKSAVIKSGGYPLFDGLCEDCWLALRILKKGYSIYNLSKYLVKVRGGDDLLTRRSGISYIKQEVLSQHATYKEWLISAGTAVINLLLRIPVRMLPKRLLNTLYLSGKRRV